MFHYRQPMSAAGPGLNSEQLMLHLPPPHDQWHPNIILRWGKQWPLSPLTPEPPKIAPLSHYWSFGFLEGKLRVSVRIPLQIMACEESLLMPHPEGVCEKPPQRPWGDEINLIFHWGPNVSPFSVLPQYWVHKGRQVRGQKDNTHAGTSLRHIRQVRNINQAGLNLGTILILEWFLFFLTGPMWATHQLLLLIHNTQHSFGSQKYLTCVSKRCWLL